MPQSMRFIAGDGQGSASRWEEESYAPFIARIGDSSAHIVRSDLRKRDASQTKSPAILDGYQKKMVRQA
jgi:hypothetical protein